MHCKGKKQNDFIRKDVEPYVYDFCSVDEHIQLDSNQDLDIMVNLRTGEETAVRRRIWTILNKIQQHLMFPCSHQYINFQQEHNGATVGYNVLSQVVLTVCIFVKKNV